MFSINFDDEKWVFWFKRSKFHASGKWLLILCKGGNDWNSSNIVLQAAADKSRINWDNSIIVKNRTDEDGMWIPDEVKDYIIECHKRFVNLLAFL